MAWHFAGMTDDDFSLAGDFPPARRQDWLKLVSAALKGKPVETLTAKTYDGLPIEPLYGHDASAKPLVARAPGTAWQVMQRVDHPVAAAANADALHDLENGATGLTLVCAGAIGAHGYGIAASDVARVLEGVFLDAAAIELDLGPQADEAVNGIVAAVQARGSGAAATEVRFGLDPLSAMAVSGASASAWNDQAQHFSGLVGTLRRQGFRGPFAAADARPVHAAAGSEAQELAYALAAAVAYLRALEHEGIALDAARRLIFFRVAGDADQFLTMAKLRALRKLWARVEDA